MKFHLSILGAFILFQVQLHACDACSCAASGNALGAIPQFGKNSTGIRWAFRSYTSTSPYSIIEGSPGESMEQFQTFEWWGQHRISKKLILLGVVPYQIAQQREGVFLRNSSGIGDASILLNYLAIQTNDSSTSKFSHILFAGAGVKLPVGEYQQEYSGELISSYLQPGTGSWDFLISASYSIRYEDIGLNTNATAQMPTFHPTSYRFGKRYNFSSRLFYWLDVKKWLFTPSVGMLYEYGSRDTNNGFYRNYSGGESLMWVGGLDIYFGNFGIGAQYLQPIYENLSRGLVHQTNRFAANLVYLF